MALNTISSTLDTTDQPSQKPVQEEEQDALIELVGAVKELQRLKIDVVTGAGAATPIALAVIATVDTIVAAVLIKDPGAAATAGAVKLTPSIPSNGNVQFAEATNAAAGDRVIVVWFDKA